MRPAWQPPPAAPSAPTAPAAHVWRTTLPDERAARRPAGRAAAEAILDRYGVTGPFVIGPHGKPADPAGGVRFNVTHTGTLLLVAVSADRDIGIDAERIRDRGDVLALARHGLDDADRTRLAAAPPEERAALFHRLWVRREAVLKCHGTGFAIPAADAPVTVVDFEVAPELPGALAAAGTGPIVPRWFDLDA